MFEKIKEEIEKEGLLIRRLNSLVSVLDVNCSLAVISKQYGYNKPIVDNCEYYFSYYNKSSFFFTFTEYSSYCY